MWKGKEEIPKPLKDSKLENVIEKWDADYILPISKEDCVSVINAANYMDIKSLLELASSKVASIIKGKTPEEIRKTFNIQNDFTPEEEQQIREENQWCMDNL